VKPEDYDNMENVNRDHAWCPGCGNYQIKEVMKKTLAELDLKPQEVVMVSGIGQAAKMPQYLNLNFFNGLHGRSIPVATAIKAANPELTVVAESGDGCMYGEGGNHLIHAALRNPNITIIVHNNMVYGLTKGQASPTSQLGFTTIVQVADRGGVTNDPLNPIAMMISLGATFIARAFIGDEEQTKEILKRAISHKGFAIVDAFIRSLETEKLPLGIFYMKNMPTFEDETGVYDSDKRPLFKREVNFEALRGELELLKRK
jgi:2-oxoglutarate ferredoxin oxidoreductase subunit beta